MAKIRFSSLGISEMSGKYGESDVIARNLGGFYTRQNNQPYSDTSYQSARRAAMTEVTQFWATLDYEEQLAWIAAAAAKYWVWSVRLNNLFIPSGQMLFIKVNISVYAWSFPVRLPPRVRQFSASDLPKVFSLEADTVEGITVELDQETIPEDTVFQIWMTGNLSTGSTRPKASWFKLIAEITAAEYSDTMDLTGEWEERFTAVAPSKRVFFKSALLDARSGRRVMIEKIFCTTTGTLPPDELEDVDSNVYTTVIIGDLEISVENWRCTKLDDGTPITEVTDGTTWAGLATPGRCSYNNDSGNGTTYGFLYNRAALTGIAPAGWRVPTLADWAAIRTSLGGGSIAGGKMKQTGTATWNSPNTDADNSSGFTGLGGGFRLGTGGFDFLNLFTGFHASDIVSPPTYNVPILAYNSAELFDSPNNDKDGYYIRLCRDV